MAAPYWEPSPTHGWRCPCGTILDSEEHYAYAKKDPKCFFCGAPRPPVQGAPATQPEPQPTLAMQCDCGAGHVKDMTHALWCSAVAGPPTLVCSDPGCDAAVTTEGASKCDYHIVLKSAQPLGGAIQVWDGEHYWRCSCAPSADLARATQGLGWQMTRAEKNCTKCGAPRPSR